MALKCIISHASLSVKLTEPISILKLEMQSTSTSLNSIGQGYLVTMAKCHQSDVCQHFQKNVSLMLQIQFQLNFICSLQAKEDSKILCYEFKRSRSVFDLGQRSLGFNILKYFLSENNRLLTIS